MSAALQWGSGRLGNVGTHMFNALCLVAGRRVAAVSPRLDLSRRLDCRGPQFQDPGGWGLLRLAGGLIVSVDAADFGTVPASITLNGTLGRAVTGASDVRLEFWDGRTEHWPAPAGNVSSMDRAMQEIVAWLDGAVPFSDTPDDSLHTLETIIACHASHQRNSAWTSLPLAGGDLDIEVRSG